MAWKKCNNYDVITFGSIIRYKGVILITTSGNTVLTIGGKNIGDTHQFYPSTENVLCAFKNKGEEFELWEFEDEAIQTTSVLKLIQEMVTK